MDVDYSPTGREFVAGGYDRSVRLFAHNGGHSREVYHTKRMQRVFAVRFSGDGNYVFSGSDDMNMRVWKVRSPNPPILNACTAQIPSIYLSILASLISYVFRAVARMRQVGLGGKHGACRHPAALA